jgi:hypothetical protein
MLTWKRRHGENLSHRRNSLPFRRGECLSVGKLAGLLPSAAQPEPLRLAPAQRAALDRTLPRLLAGYLYEASLNGPSAYLAAARLCSQCRHGALALTPRHLARLAIRGGLQRALRAVYGG